jgi:hypothetical protein
MYTFPKLLSRPFLNTSLKTKHASCTFTSLLSLQPHLATTPPHPSTSSSPHLYNNYLQTTIYLTKRATMPYDPLFHTTNNLGAIQITTSSGTRTQFRLFFPSAPSTNITSISVGGTFQSAIGEPNWDFTQPHLLTQSSAAASPPEGTFWTLLLDQKLPDGFYEYKYQVTFNDAAHSIRLVSDPCARYSGSDPESSGFVVGGSTAAENPIAVLGVRKPLKDLVIYEMHIGDFTAGYRESRAPLDAGMCFCFCLVTNSSALGD